MTQTMISTATAGARDLGLVGTRQLHAVQLIDIGRLTSHVVPFVPGTFVAISGRGPKGDSNESGKTTFLAATSLLLGDSEWKLRSGGQHASTLLFNPHAVGAAEHLADAADHGYVIGLFALPGEPPTDPLSVWIRINRTTPYLELKAHHGQSLVDPEGPRPVQLAADDQWAELKHLTGGRPLGASSFVESLYGNAPRCIAHLTKRGDLSSGVSLLNTNAGAFSREQIGAALVSLAARQDILDDDRSQRSLLDEAEQELAAIQQQSEAREREYERQLTELDGRDRARQLLATATHDWETHDARRYIDAIDAYAAKHEQYESARRQQREVEQAARVAAQNLAAISDHEALHDHHTAASRALADADHRLEAAIEKQSALAHTVTTVRDRLRDLKTEAAGWQGPSPTETQATEQTARQTLAEAERQAAIAAVELEAARQLLKQAEQGRGEAASTLQTLENAGIGAVGLLDSVTIDTSMTSTLEPLLWPYRDAAVVKQEELAAAVDALAEQPWAMVISGPTDHSAPVGVAECPAAARKFLAALAARASTATNPARASDAELGVTIIAGRDALAGREARIRTATDRVQAVESAFSTAERLRAEAALLAEARADDHRRATAAAEVALQATELKTREEDFDRARTQRATIKAERDRLQVRERELAVQLAAIDAERQRHEAELARANQALADHQDTSDRLSAELHALDETVTASGQQWGSGEERARTRCQQDARDEGRLRNIANDALNEALYEIGMRRDQEWAPTDDLVDAWRRRREDENTTPFPALAQPLADYLHEHSDRDIVLRERIETDREQTAEALQAAKIEVAQTRAALARIQDAIETSIEAAISAIEEQFDRLDREAGGHGAKLELEMRRPANATDTWHWSVTPMWRRSPDGRMVPYTAPTNSAQDKLYTVNLVLAALLAVPNPEGRVLILDELGDSLGYEHRRDMLRAIAATAHAKQITVLGTCQDDVLHHAADFTQEIVFFEYSDTRDLLNRPVRLFGYDPQGDRVELTREAVLRGRPPV